MGGGGGRCWGGGGYKHKSRHIFHTRHIVMTCSTEPYSLMKIFPSVFKIEGIVALTIKEDNSEYKGESCHSCMQHILKTCLSQL